MSAPAGPALVDTPPGYREAIDEALIEYGARNYAEARSMFSRAHALYPNARTFRGLGIAEFELRNYRKSAEHLSAALSATERSLDPALRAETEALLVRARNFLGELTLDVQPAQTRVLIDGAPVDAGSSVVLEVGDHELQAHADGYVSERRVVSVRGGDRQALSIVLKAPAQVQLAQATTAQRREPSSGAGPLPYVVMGVSGALLIGGGVLLVLAQQDIATVEDAERGVTWAELEDAYDGAPAKSTAGFILLGVGAVGLGAGLVWKLTSSSGESAQLRLNGRGLAFRSTFR